MRDVRHAGLQRIAIGRDGHRVLDRIPSSLLRSRLRGPLGIVPLLIRLGAGTAVIGFGIGKFADHAKEVSDFRGFGVPMPEIAVPLAGTIETVGGVLVVIGLLTRLGALAIAANLVGALLTAGVNEGGTFHLVVGPTIMILMLVLVVTGAGPLSADEWILSRRSPRSTRR